MSNSTDTSCDEDGERSVHVRRLARSPGTTIRHIEQAVRTTLENLAAYSISVAVIDDTEMAILHARYLNDPTPTDVLSFDLRDDPDDSIEGEVVISAETAKRQAEELGVDAHEELLRYAIHGTLHLMGYDDRTPAERGRMRREENRVLSKLSNRCGKRQDQR